MRIIFPPKPTSTGSRPPSDNFFKLAKRNPYFVVEAKKDGFACVVYFEKGKIYYYNRHGQQLDKIFIYKSIKELEKQNIPDGTILGCEAIGKRTKEIKDKLSFYSVYQWQGQYTNQMSLKENKALLKQIVRPVENRIEIVDYFTLEQCHCFAEYYFKVTQFQDNEGIILKDIRKPVTFDWASSKKLPYWFKFKLEGR